MSTSFDWSILVVVLGAGVVCLPIVLTLFTRQKENGTTARSTWLPMGLLGVGAAVGFILVIWLLRSHEVGIADQAPEQIVFRPDSNMTSLPPIAVAVDAHSDGEIWRDVVDEEFDADIYPSSVIAARALARQLVPLVKSRVLPEDASPTGFTIVPESGLPNEGDIASELASVLQARFTVPAMIGEATAVPPAEGSGQILVSLTSPRKRSQASAPWGSGQPEISGSLKATVPGETGEFELASQFIEKPWVAQFDQFASSNPQRNFVLARSDHFSASPESAFLIADQRGAESITRMLMPLVQEGQVTLIPDIEIQTRNTIRWLIQSGVFVRDRFVQRLKRPYGDVYRAAVLFEVQPHQLETLRGEIYTISRNRQRDRQASVSFLGGAVVIFGVVTLLCLFLNQATRGYYRAKLSAVCLCGGAVLIGGAFLWINIAQSQVDLRSRLTVQDLTVQNAVPVTRTRQRASAKSAASPVPLTPAPPVVAPPRTLLKTAPVQEGEPEDGGGTTAEDGEPE